MSNSRLKFGRAAPEALLPADMQRDAGRITLGATFGY